MNRKTKEKRKKERNTNCRNMKYKDSGGQEREKGGKEREGKRKEPFVLTSGVRPMLLR